MARKGRRVLPFLVGIDSHCFFAIIQTMKKIIAALPILALMSVYCSEAPVIGGGGGELPTPTDRTVLIEFFTEDG